MFAAVRRLIPWQTVEEYPVVVEPEPAPTDDQTEDDLSLPPAALEQDEEGPEDEDLEPQAVEDEDEEDDDDPVTFTISPWSRLVELVRRWSFPKDADT